MQKKLISAAVFTLFTTAAFGNNVFVTLDADENNTISKKEATALSSLIEQWDSLDADNSGELSKEEFSKYAVVETSVMEKIEMEEALPEIK